MTNNELNCYLSHTQIGKMKESWGTTNYTEYNEMIYGYIMIILQCISNVWI